jgi:hypothetical protein
MMIVQRKAVNVTEIMIAKLFSKAIPGSIMTILIVYGERITEPILDT